MKLKEKLALGLQRRSRSKVWTDGHRTNDGRHVSLAQVKLKSVCVGGSPEYMLEAAEKAHRSYG